MRCTVEKKKEGLWKKREKYAKNSERLFTGTGSVAPIYAATGCCEIIVSG